MANRGKLQEILFLEMNVVITGSLCNSLLQWAGEQRQVLCHWILTGLVLFVPHDPGWNWGSSRSLMKLRSGAFAACRGIWGKVGQPWLGASCPHCFPKTNTGCWSSLSPVLVSSGPVPGKHWFDLRHMQNLFISVLIWVLAWRCGNQAGILVNCQGPWFSLPMQMLKISKIYPIKAEGRL